VLTYTAGRRPAEPHFGGRWIFLLAGLLLSATSIFIAGLNGWQRGATLPEQII
jgi:hypothetical protein